MPSKKSETNAQTLLNAESKNKPDAGKQSVDLNAPGVATMVAKRVAEDIDEYNIRAYDGGHRWHLGASLIGDECARKLWYIFRWCYRESYKTPSNHARMQRLFNRGHREEARYVEWLEGIGAQVWYENRAGLTLNHTTDEYFIAKDGEVLSPDCEPIFEGHTDYLKHVACAKADGLEFPQYRVSGVMGHFGGSLDGIVKLPPRYGIDEPVLAEFKTNGTGQAFNKLGESGMAVAKPQHFAQTSTYGSDVNYGFRYVLYFNINKNDDSLHVELVKLDHKLGEQTRIKAERIIMSQEPPPRLSDNPTFSKCQYCPAMDICHKGAIPEKNCRSCKNASPSDGGEWFCDVHKGIIPRDFVPQGCPSYIPITARAANV